MYFRCTLTELIVQLILSTNLENWNVKISSKESLAAKELVLVILQI